MAKVGRLVKEAMVAELSERLSKREDLLVTSLGRLSAAEADVLRRKLYASQARLIVIKRTLARRAVERLNLSGCAELFEGSVGFVLPGEESLPVAKLLVEFVKTHEARLAVRGAFIEGQLLDSARVEYLASLPPKPVLLAQVVGLVESPIAHLIATVEQLIGEVCWLVEQAATKRTEASNVEEEST